MTTLQIPLIYLVLRVVARGFFLITDPPSALDIAFIRLKKVSLSGLVSLPEVLLVVT